MNEFIKKFSQYFIYENTAHVGLLYHNMALFKLPSLLRTQGDYSIVVDISSVRIYFVLATNEILEANEIYERIINFYNENIKEK